MSQSLLTPAEEARQSAVDKAVRQTWRSDAELAMRGALEEWARQRWPAARIVHELVIGRGLVRADMAAIDPAHIAAFEIKSPLDDVSRLIHQIALYRLAVPELWLVTDDGKSRDAELIHYLLPSVGVLLVSGLTHGARYNIATSGDPLTLTMTVVAEAEPFRPDPECLLSLCWAAELFEAAKRRRVFQGKGSKPPAHSRLVEAMRACTPEEQLADVCQALRQRNAFWRADPPIEGPAP